MINLIKQVFGLAHANSSATGQGFQKTSKGSKTNRPSSVGGTSRVAQPKKRNTEKRNTITPTVKKRASKKGTGRPSGV